MNRATELHLDPATSALVLIDLQAFIQAAPATPRSGADVIKTAASLAEGFRAAGALVVQVVAALGVGGGVVLAHPPVDAPMTMQLPRDWDAIPAELGPDPRDVIVTKWGWDAFYGTDLDVQLRRRGITTIALGGVSASIGVESAARHAYELGYHQVFPEEALASFTPDEYRHTLGSVFPRLGRVRSAEAVLSALC
jgi:nicotinamidase-related amidase